MKLHGLSNWTMFIFGASAAILGLVGLFSPETLLSLLQFESVPRTQRATVDYTVVYLIASSMASLNMGIYYVLAAFTNLKQFFVWTVPFRIVTFVVFTIVAFSGTAPQRFFIVAIWELIGALATGFALYWERRGASSAESVPNAASR